MYSLIPATPSTVTLDEGAGGWVGSHLRSSSLGDWEIGVESIQSEGSICPHTFGAKSTSGASFEGHSVGFHAGSYRNESFPETLLKVSQPAIELGVGDITGDGVPEAEAETAGIVVADGADEPVLFASHAAMPITRRTRAPDRAKVRVSVIRISSLSRPLRGTNWIDASDNGGYLPRGTRLTRQRETGRQTQRSRVQSPSRTPACN